MVPLRFPGVTLALPLPLLALYGALALLWIAVVALLLPQWPRLASWARLAAYSVAMATGPVLLFVLLILPQHWYWMRPI